MPLDESPDRLWQLPPTGLSPWTRDNLPPRLIPQENIVKKGFKLCIVGAGMAGLYIALILDTLDIPGISFDFFEASDRVGGRCFTHEFSKIPHDYYDVGAMRFPNIPVMDRTFDLFNRTGTNANKITYYYSDGTVNCPMLFNNVRLLKSKTSPEWSTNPFKVDGVSNIYAHRNPGDIMSEVMKPYVDALDADPVRGFRKLMEVDHYSIREYLSQKTPYNDYRGIEYLETFSGSTTSFNNAFSEAVIEAIDFAADKWWCIEGGVEVIARNVWKKLRTKPQVKKKVTRIARDWTTPTSNFPPIRIPRKLAVNIEGADKALSYDTVFCTTTLGCMQKMDLRDAQLNWGQKSAIRGLTYGPATKVAIKFSRPWWITDSGIKFAGIGSTDELIRTCVYPSYNLHDGDQNPTVLLCSYCWTQDALRLGSLVRPDSPNGEDELKEALLQGLARLHDIKYEVIKPLYVTHHAWNWYQDPNTMGAYASFGPADFSTLYPYLTRPAGGGLLHFAGEAMSAHHAWIVGALESGYRAVSAFFDQFGLWEAKRRLRREFGPPPPELEVGDNGTQHLQTVLGSLSDQERERLEAAMFESEVLVAQ
jgi:monoamine oxidase